MGAARASKSSSSFSASRASLPARLATDPRLRALDRDAGRDVSDVSDARFSLDPKRGCCGRKCALRRCDVGLRGGLLV